MSYENTTYGTLRLESFDRTRVMKRWLWAWEGLVSAVPGVVGPDGVIDLVGDLRGTPVGTVDQVSGPVSSEFRFADTSSYITFGDQPQLKLTGPVTIALMHSPETTDRAALWCYAGAQSSGCPFSLVYSFNGNQLYSFWNDNNANAVASVNTYTPGTRNFVLARRLGDNSANPVADIFVNGLFEATATLPLASSWNDPDTAYQQAINRFGGFAGYAGVGSVSNILIWNRALSDAEVFALSEDPWGPFRQEVPTISRAASIKSVTIGADANVAGGITYVGAGTFTSGDYNVATNPPLPSGVITNDLLVCFTYFRSAGTVTSTWATQTSFHGSSTNLLVSYRVATGSDTPPTITPATGSSGQHTASIVLAFRGCLPSAPFGASGTAAQYAAAEDIGPIAPATTSQTEGAVIVFAGRSDPNATNIDFPVLTGDGLTWNELVDAKTIDIASHIGVNFATWQGGAPTLTAKTFDIATGSATATSAGVMFTLIKNVSGQVIYVGKGADSRGDHTAVLVPALPAVQSGDLLFTVAYLRNAGTLSISSGWTQHTLVDTTVNASSFYLQTWYRFAGATNSSPTITLTGGVTSPQSLCLAFVLAYRGVDATVPFGTPGDDTFNTVGANVGPIAAPTSPPASGAVLVLGIRNATVWTSVLTLDGDGLSWVELFDTYTHTVNSLGISLVMDHAIWSTGVPTITAKTFIPTGGAGGPGMGKMFVLRAASSASGPTIVERNIPFDVVTAATFSAITSADVVVEQTGVWVGPASIGDHDDVLTPALPSGLSVGDFVMAFGYIRNAGTLSISSGWTEHSLLDTNINATAFYLQTWYRFIDGTEVAPTITISGGATSPQSLTTAFIIAAKNISQVAPFGADGTDSFNVVQQNIGPVSLPSSVPSSGIVLVLGVRNSTGWTSVDTLTGDGLTWIEAIDGYSNSVAGLNTDIVLDYATWENATPTLTAKTFTVTGGASGPGMGKSFVLNRTQVVFVSSFCNADTVVATQTQVSVTADASVILGSTSVSVDADAYITQGGVGVQTAQFDLVIGRYPSISTSLDCYALTQTGTTKAISCVTDAAVNPALLFVSAIVFADVIINPPITSPTAPLSATQELSAEATDSAWLVLLTLYHEEMTDPIRVTSDGVPTISRGNVYSPFPFDVILPDDVEGAPPQAQLRIDNTTQEIIAALRDLTTPPSLTIEIVRSISVDNVEYSWLGLRWTSSSYDKGVITGTLTVDDLAKEEFPYMTFDSRWRGLWP